MKKKTTFSLCAVLLLAGFFGLQAVSESHLPFWEVVGLIAAILAAMFLVAAVINKSLQIN